MVGAIVSATDPVAVVATMRQLRAPSSLVTLIDAESLFNDGTAVLVYAIALGGLSGQVSLASGAVSFVVGVVASVAIGALIGYAIAWLAGRTEDHLIELMLTLLAAYGTYVVADRRPPVRDHRCRRRRDHHRDLSPRNVVHRPGPGCDRHRLGVPGVRPDGRGVPPDRHRDLARVAVDRRDDHRLGGRCGPCRPRAGDLWPARRIVGDRPSAGHGAPDPAVVAARDQLDGASWCRRDGLGAVASERHPQSAVAPGHDLRDRPVHGDRAGHDRRTSPPLGGTGTGCAARIGTRDRRPATRRRAFAGC